MIKSQLTRDLCCAVGSENVLAAPSELAVYGCGPFGHRHHPPRAVVFPRSSEQVSEIMRIGRDHQCPVVPRGAGTGIHGETSPAAGVVVAMTRMNRILDICLRDALAQVETGVVGCQLSRALRGTGYHLGPDSLGSDSATIGGRVAMGGSGSNTIKYGRIASHVLGLEAVLADGSILRFGPVEDPASLDPTGIFCGSLGRFGIITQAWLRLSHDPEERRTHWISFGRMDQAVQAANRIISDGLRPTALEVIDRGFLDLIERAFKVGYPADAGAVLLIELDGLTAELDEMDRQITEGCRGCGAERIERVRIDAERELVWKSRRQALGAIGRSSPNCAIHEGCIPRSRLPDALEKIEEIASRRRIKMLRACHVAEGVVQAVVLFDERDPAGAARARDTGRELAAAFREFGGIAMGQDNDAVNPDVDVDRHAMERVRRALNPSGRNVPTGDSSPAIADFLKN